MYTVQIFMAMGVSRNTLEKTRQIFIMDMISEVFIEFNYFDQLGLFATPLHPLIDDVMS